MNTTEENRRLIQGISASSTGATRAIRGRAGLTTCAGARRAKFGGSASSAGKASVLNELLGPVSGAAGPARAVVGAACDRGWLSTWCRSERQARHKAGKSYDNEYCLNYRGPEARS